MKNISKASILEMESRVRATLINSLAGFKTVVLIGTKSSDGFSNLAIFNSLVHIGANPPMFAFILRPDTVRRDTLSNILETGYYTFNYVKSTDFEKAHQTSAKYDSSQSEFDAVGFKESYLNDFYAPFIESAAVKIGMKFLERIDIQVNGTIMIIGSVEFIQFDENIMSEDGFLSLEKADVLACTGLDAYYKTEFIDRLSYAKPDKWPESIVK